MNTELLRKISIQEVTSANRQAVDQPTLDQAAAIISQVRHQGDQALQELGKKFNDLGPDGKLVYTAAEMKDALAKLPEEQQSLLQRVANRIKTFAQAQRQVFQDQATDILGGQAGWRFTPIKRAGCYAPGGRFPLPSSVLMTAVTARAAGVQDVWVASPCPGDVTLAAAAIAGADFLLAAGGAQAIAALAYGTRTVAACDVIVGPGNRYVTAAKQLVSGQVGIEMLAGPSELVILADESAASATVAADLLGQAEHDPDAVPILVTASSELATAVNLQLEKQLTDLPTAAIARQSLNNGGVILVQDLAEGERVCDLLAPEHLEILVANPDASAGRLTRFGGLFIGAESAEVFGDYGAGPNHVLPTGGTARFTGGLSVQDFLVCRTWLMMDSTAEMAEVARDARDLAKLEGLAAHARSAEKRLQGSDKF